MSEWIRVEDRLPPVGLRVLVFNKFDEAVVAKLCWDGVTFEISEDDPVLYPTHWQPLPDPSPPDK